MTRNKKGIRSLNTESDTENLLLVQRPYRRTSSYLSYPVCILHYRNEVPEEIMKGHSFSYRVPGIDLCFKRP
jgi:hypothetical protein